MATLVWLGIVGLWVLALLYLLYNLRLQWAATWLPKPEPPPPERLPTVTIQIPIFNEGELALTLLQAILKIDYPRECLQLQILDDSTDATADLLQQWVANVDAHGLAIDYRHRTIRTDYKAGALAKGLPHATGELLLLLDADFLPPRDTLRRLVRWFADPQLAFVQARWGVLNAFDSFASRLASYWVQQHFEIDQPARSRLNAFMHFNGTAGVCRKQAIVDAGGWSGATLAEDFDLSLRIWFLRTYTVAYDMDMIVPSLVPTSMRALKSQQARWATGSFQVFRQNLAAVVRCPFPENVTLLAHVSGYLFGSIILLLALVTLPAVLLEPTAPRLHVWLCEVPGFVFFGIALAQIVELAQRRGISVSLRQCYYLTLGLGLSPWIMRHCLRGWWQHGGEFVRTPKGRYRAHSARGYLGSAILEFVIGVYCLGTSIYCVSRGFWGSAYLPLILSIGLLYVAITSLASEQHV